MPIDAIFLIFLTTDMIVTACGKEVQEDMSGWSFWISGVLTAVTGLVGVMGIAISLWTLLHRSKMLSYIIKLQVFSLGVDFVLPLSQQEEEQEEPPPKSIRSLNFDT